MAPARGEITQLLAELSKGNRHAEAKLVPLVYNELRRLAGRYMRRERSDHTLQPTALVHEAYIRLVEQRGVNWQSRAHFFGVAAELMRRILVDHARSRQAAKRGGMQQRVEIDDPMLATAKESTDLLALDEALARLGELDPRQSRIVELRFFGGMTVEETAEVLSISPKTVKRDWSVARAWLHAEISRGASV